MRLRTFSEGRKKCFQKKMQVILDSEIILVRVLWIPAGPENDPLLNAIDVGTAENGWLSHLPVPLPSQIAQAAMPTVTMRRWSRGALATPLELILRSSWITYFFWICRRHYWLLIRSERWYRVETVWINAALWTRNPRIVIVAYKGLVRQFGGLALGRIEARFCK